MIVREHLYDLRVVADWVFDHAASDVSREMVAKLIHDAGQKLIEQAMEIERLRGELEESAELCSKLVKQRDQARAGGQHP